MATTRLVVICRRAARTARYWTDPEAGRATSRRYRERNPEKHRASVGAWRASLQDGRGKIYFVQTASGPIKIGWTKLKAPGRLAQLQIGSYEVLRLLGWIYAEQTEEVQLHDRFRPLRLRGEWFSPDADLLTFIQENVSDGTRLWSGAMAACFRG